MKKSLIIPLLLGLVLFIVPNNIDDTRKYSVFNSTQKFQAFAKQTPCEGGNVSPDGTEEIQIDVPVELRVKNCGGSDGSGLCVFTSIMHDARFQNVIPLFYFQNYMKKHPGGGYPEKVDRMIASYLQEQGLPKDSVLYIQDTTGNAELLKEALKSGRPVGITYDGNDCHYSHSIAHMVTLVHFTDNWAAILDNNFIGQNQIVWMRPQELIKRWKGNSGGWSVILLDAGAPPVPHN